MEVRKETPPTSRVLVPMVDLMMSMTIPGDTEFDSRFRERIDLFDWNYIK